ncbi:hypothetical protein P691DRAFT_783544 [Macrolepiota fuliginosa MF-IS2]|uniref:NACHT domain-containing protein n=1 Tax=Macrolepiota fuliginosa MF-IS2 TaxID=1400762 RepID=A0A9P6BW45_9AGAR|nr:hypothetical protein P691DRAFT_783544 [Macrolepiota fuliginosa MF-IS2]
MTHPNGDLLCTVILAYKMTCFGKSTMRCTLNHQSGLYGSMENGTGKSAIMFTNYELYLQELLGFVHPHITLPQYSLSQQFKEIFYRPFKKLGTRLFGHSKLMFILLDGLNFVQYSDNRWTLDKGHTNLITHIVQFAEDCPDAPIRWVISTTHVSPPSFLPRSIMALEVKDIIAEFFHVGRIPALEIQHQFDNLLSRAAFHLFHHPLPPPCYPNTTVELLASICKWIQDSSNKKKILWLIGPTGIGKTAIMWLLMETEISKTRSNFKLGAALFLSSTDIVLVGVWCLSNDKSR